MFCPLCRGHEMHMHACGVPCTDRQTDRQTNRTKEGSRSSEGPEAPVRGKHAHTGQYSKGKETSGRRGNLQKCETHVFISAPPHTHIHTQTRTHTHTHGVRNKAQQCRLSENPHQVDATHTHTHTHTHTSRSTKQERSKKSGQATCANRVQKGFQSPVQVRPAGSSKQVSNRQWVTGAQGQLQLGFTRLSLSISAHLRCDVLLSLLTSTRGRPLHQGSSHRTEGLTG